MEVLLKVDEELTENLWVRNKERAGAGDIIVGMLQMASPGSSNV